MKDRTAYKIILAISIICILIFIFLIPFRFSGFLIRSDGISYYAYLRSLVFGDANHYNEFIHFNCQPQITANGLAHNQETIGPALLWMPFYLFAHLIITIIRQTGIPVQADGYGIVYQAAACIGTIIYVTMGFFLIYRISRKYFSEFSSILAVLGIWLAGNPIYYTIIEPSMSQGLQIFTTALFMYIWLSLRSRTYKDWFLMGLSIGLMILVHLQNLIFLSGLLIVGYCTILNDKAKKWKTMRRYIGVILIVGSAALLVYTPQMLAWKVIFGCPIVNAHGPNQLNLLHPKLWQYLFAPGCSLFCWTPIIFPAVLGFVPLYKRDRKLALSLLIIVALQWYFYSSVIGYAYGAYGARHFVSSSPIFVLTLAALVESRVKKHPREYLWIALMFIILLIWNFLFITQYTLKFIPHDGSISWDELIWGKFRMIRHLIKISFRFP